MSTPLLIIGGGNMGSAILAGGMASGILAAETVAVVEIEPAARAALAASCSVRTFADVSDGARWLESRIDGQLLLAVKPQSLAAVAPALVPVATDRIVISVLAGTPGERVRRAMPAARVVRAMPNLALRVRQGVTALCPSAGARPGDERFACGLFGAGGQLVVCLEEHLMDAFTALAGSGPAYVFYLAEAMVRAGIELGMEPATALNVVRQTITGSAALLASSNDDPAALRDAVTSKGGTTAAACSVLNARHVADAFIAAISAARDRGRELAG